MEQVWKAMEPDQRGNILYWCYQDRTLYIRGQGCLVLPNGTPWKTYISEIRHVVIGEGCTSICNDAFYGYKMKTVFLPDTLTRIGAYAFCNCERLTEITIPGSVNRIEEYAFCSCHALRFLTLQEGVRVIEHKAFAYCQLYSLFLPASVRKIYNCAFFVYGPITVAKDNPWFTSVDGVLFDKELCRQYWCPREAVGYYPGGFWKPSQMYIK